MAAFLSVVCPRQYAVQGQEDQGSASPSLAADLRSAKVTASAFE